MRAAAAFAASYRADLSLVYVMEMPHVSRRVTFAIFNKQNSLLVTGRITHPRE